MSEYLHFAENGYKRNLVRVGPNYHAWLLCWKNGQRSPIHNHRGSACVVRVLRGTLTETLFELAPNGHVKATFLRDFSVGSLIGSEDTEIHQVFEFTGRRRRPCDIPRLHAAPQPDVHVFTIRPQSRVRSLGSGIQRCCGHLNLARARSLDHAIGRLRKSLSSNWSECGVMLPCRKRYGRFRG